MSLGPQSCGGRVASRFGVAGEVVDLICVVFHRDDIDSEHQESHHDGDQESNDDCEGL